MHHKKWCQCCTCYHQTLGLDLGLELGLDYLNVMDYYETMEENDNL